MKITKLIPSQYKEGRWLVQLENGLLLRIGQNDVADLGLYQGLNLSDEQYTALQEAVQTAEMKNKALNALTVRPMSRRELVDKLTAKSRRAAEEAVEQTEEAQNAQKERADAIADRLEDLGLIDDQAYAVRVVQHYASKGCGERRIKDELFRRGVPKDYWDEALATLPEPDHAINTFLNKKLRGWTGDPKELKRASDALVRRGFSWQDISVALRRYGAEES